MDKKDIINYFNQTAKDRLAWKAKNKYYYQELEKYLRFLIPEGSSVIEIGCGTAELLNSVRPSRGMGIDFSQKMIEIAERQFPHLEFRIEDAENMTVEGKFDYIILSDLIGCLLDVQRTFSQLKRISGPQTRIIITYYNFLWEPILKLSERFGLKTPQPLQNWISLYDIENLLYLSDFEVIKKGYKLLLPKHIPFISAFFNRFLANVPLFSKLCLTEFVIARPRPTCNDKNNAHTCSIIVPCRNERGNIRSVIERIPALGSHTEVLFIEGHSKDSTLEEINEQISKFPAKDIKVFIQDGIGKGNAVRTGFSKAKGDILMILDADLTVFPEDLPKFYNALIQGKGELIMGSRLVYPVEEGAMRFLNLLGNKFFSSLFSYLLEQRIKDTLCGTKVLFSSDYRKIDENRKFFGDFDPFGDFDLIFGATKQNLKIVEIPIRYAARTYGATQISRFKHGLLLLKMSWIAFKRLRMA